MSGHSLVLPFDTDGVEFALGFECGRVYQALRDDEGPYECEVHAANAEMVIRIAEATGRSVRSDEIGDGWLTVHFDEAGH